MHYESVRDNCLMRWQSDISDPRIDHFVKCLKDFNDILPIEIDKCIEIMLMRFVYYSHANMNKAYKELHNSLFVSNKVDIDKTVFSVLKSQIPKLNSSYQYLFEYKSINNLSKYYCVPELSDLFNKPYWNMIDNIVLIDDICGTGKTFNDYILSIKNNVVNKSIYYIVIHIMADAEARIEKMANENNIKVFIISRDSTPAAFSYDDLNLYKEHFIECSKDLGIKKSDVLGFKYRSNDEQAYSESLVAFYENTPNDTLGIFREHTEKNNPLFPREYDKKPLWLQMRNRKQQKSESNYSSKICDNYE